MEEVEDDKREQEEKIKDQSKSGGGRQMMEVKQECMQDEKRTSKELSKE